MAIALGGLCVGLLAVPGSVVAEEVDVELALMVDVSRSMAPYELSLQRRGYAEALVSDQVVNAILSSFTGKIALTYVEWAGDGSQRLIVPWTVIDGRESAEAVAAILREDSGFGMRRTSISGAIKYGIEGIEGNAFKGLRRVIDISGDGPNNDGSPVERSRDRAIEAGIVINGLPLMTWEPEEVWGIPDLNLYYEACVIGGPGAFVIPVHRWEDFPLAVRRKIVLELAGPPDVVLVAEHTRPKVDCMIGEKKRRERQRWFELP
ncbi:MAG: DUF1194 domain-containing protein [Boseongicola sp.]|nr:MAG: DUF1194 domain-containing protein [Boseongicola sp.]